LLAENLINAKGSKSKKKPWFLSYKLQASSSKPFICLEFYISLQFILLAACSLKLVADGSQLI